MNGSYIQMVKVAAARYKAEREELLLLREEVEQLRERDRILTNLEERAKDEYFMDHANER